MLDTLDRKQVFDGLKTILKIRALTQSQVDGLNAFFDACQRDPLVPSGLVGIQRVAYWIYTMVVETDRKFQPIQEYGGRAYFIRRYGSKTKKGKELGNDTDEESVAYSGKGLVQTTGEDNVERLEAHVREHYPWIVEAVERETGRPFDLTIGDQPDDSDDVKNLLRFDVAYVALVAGTTFAFYGPPISRYINAKVCDYKGARKCVNGTDRDDEFAEYCPEIEALLVAAVIDKEPVAEQPPAETSTTTTIENAGAVNLTAAVPSVTPAAVQGGGSADAAVAVTNGSGSWIRTVLTWITGIFTMASEYVQQAFGLSPEIQKILIYILSAIGIVWLVLKAVAEWQIRHIAADPTKQNVK